MDFEIFVFGQYCAADKLLMYLRVLLLSVCTLQTMVTLAAGNQSLSIADEAGDEYTISVGEMVKAAARAKAKGFEPALKPSVTTEMPSEPANATMRKSKKQRLPELHHVVGVPLAKTMHPKEALELGEKQELVCATCHGIEKIDEIPLDKVDTKATNFLKGGPYAMRTDFCYRCHQEKENARPNIHRMLDEQSNIREQHCTYCHEKPLKRDQVYKPEELKLRVPRETICFGCHLKTPHLNALQHQDKPSKEKLKQLREAEKKLGMSLPLSNEGKLMCVTCHSPHPNGVLKATLPAAKQVANNDLKTGITYAKHPWGDVFAEDKQQRLEELERKTGQLQELAYQRIKTEVLLRLPAKDGSLCLACHTFTDRE